MKTQSVVALVLSAFGVAVVSVTAACNPLPCGQDQTAHYTPAQDDVAVAGMQTAWSGTLSDGRALTFSICEDVGNATVPEAGSCGNTAVHVIRGEDQGKDESFTESGSCAMGGCTHGVAMNAKGTLTIDGVATVLTGIVGSEFDKPYDQTAWSATFSDSLGTTKISFPFSAQFANADLVLQIPGNGGDAAPLTTEDGSVIGDPSTASASTTVTGFKTTGAAQCH